MKAPSNFDSQWYYTIQGEARRVAREIVYSVALGREKPKYIKVPLDEMISFSMDSNDVEKFLHYFNCPGLYVTRLEGKKQFVAIVRSDLVTLNILRSISKVKPVRVNRKNKI